MDSEDKKKELVREFFNSGYTFEDFLNEAMEQEHITSADIIHASDIYDAPPENDMTEKEECIEAIKDAFDKIWFAHNDEVTLWQKRQYLPDERSIIEIITDYYDSDDLLDYFEDSDMLDALDGSYALKKHDEEVADDAKEDVIDDIVIELEREEIVREFLEKTPDEWWSFLCDIFGCTYYDKEAFETGFIELKEKLEKSNYYKMSERYG